MADISRTNEKLLRNWDGLSGNSREAKLLIFHARGFADDLGGVDRLNHAELMRCKRLAELTMLLETDIGNLLTQSGQFSQIEFQNSIRTYNALAARHERQAAEYRKLMNKDVIDTVYG